jgi:hypothetical protein
LGRILFTLLALSLVAAVSPDHGLGLCLEPGHEAIGLAAMLVYYLSPLPDWRAGVAWLIRVMRLIRGTRVHLINHVARIHHVNCGELGLACEPCESRGCRGQRYLTGALGLLDHCP